jgi:hypothetical protein
MAQKKKVSKNKETKNTKDIVEENEEGEVVGKKAKKSVDLESALEPANIIDEKTEDEIPVITDDSEESTSEELSLDDDELNPFGDKWEQ